MITALCIGANMMGFIILCIMFYNTGRQSSKQLVDLKLFKFMQLSVLLFLLFDTVSYFAATFDFPYNREVNIVVCTIYFVLLPLTIFIWFLYCEYKVYNDKSGLIKRLRIYIIPLVINILLVLTSQLTRLVFYIDAENIYHRGDYMFLSWIVIYGYSLGSYYLVAVKTKNKPTLRPVKGINVYFYLFQLPPIILGTVQILLPGTYLIGIGMVISMFIIFANIHNRRLTEIAIEQHEQQLTQNRISTILSQLKPHFVYNSITAISDLCSENPEAQKALVAFSDYLRINLSSLKQKPMVSFVTEVNHIKHYLSLEKLRFEDRMQIVYDIKAADFMIPILSVQPIIENAVSHGLFNKPDGGTIRLRTREAETEYVITVVDDGVGFDIDLLNDPEKNHQGIDNVKNRLASMCGGTLTIFSKPGVGTRVQIIIPKEGAE